MVLVLLVGCSCNGGGQRSYRIGAWATFPRKRKRKRMSDLKSESRQRVYAICSYELKRSGKANWGFSESM